jgi:hypothetical protein
MNIKALVQALADANADFVIIGGWSAILHGSNYITLDLDISFSRERSNLRKLVRALAPFHPKLRNFPAALPFVWDEATLGNGTVFTLVTDLGDIDLLGEVAGVGGFQDVKQASVLMEAFDRKVWTLDLPALVRAKKAAGREKDLRILPELEGLLEAREPEDGPA